MGPSKGGPRVYTLPDCPNCEALKRLLKEKKIPFEERTFDTEAQVEFIMRNVFGNPPILEASSRTMPSEALFVDENLNEEKVLEVLGSEEA